MEIVIVAFFAHLLVQIATWKVNRESLGQGHGVQHSKWCHSFFAHLLVQIATWKVNRENLGQGHGVQHSKWFHSLENINLYKVVFEHFSLGLILFQILTFQNLWHSKCRSRSWCTTFAVAPFDEKYLTSYLMAIVMFAFFQCLLVKIGAWKVWPWKRRSRSWHTIFSMTLFDGKCQNLQTSFFTFFIFAKVKPVWTKVTDMQADRHTDTEMDKPILLAKSYRFA